MVYPEEKHEIVGPEFEPCAKYVFSGRVCGSKRRFAVRNIHLGLYCENGHSLPWPMGKPWASPDELRDLGFFEEWGLPPDAFPSRSRTPQRKRRGGWDLSESRRAQFLVEINRSDARCLLCGNTAFKGERDSIEAILWLQRAERLGLYAEVVDAINRMMPKPTKELPNWYSRLPDDLKFEVLHRFDDSRLLPDHPFPIVFLQAAQKREPNIVTEEVKRFGVDAMAMPACELCNRGRGARISESRADLLQRWADYRFQGVVAAVRAHPEFAYFEVLADLAYNTDIMAEVQAAMRQRPRSA
jgi:hypothetical protein